MNTQEILNTINSNNYDFLRNDPRLGNNILLLTVGGSHAYGTNIHTSSHISDLDLRGIYNHSKEEILTMNYNDKPYENKNLDVSIYPLKQMVSLLVNANPNVLEMLGTKPDHIFMITEGGRLLRDNVNLFLTHKVYASFGGYATQQLGRLKNALARDSYSQPNKEQHILTKIENQMATFEQRYQPLSNKQLKLYIDKSNKELYDEEIFIDMDLNRYPLRDLSNFYADMSQVIHTFDKLNHRNKKKDEQHLLKHAMHLIRLLIMGTEILEGKGVNTFRTNDKEFLLNIRNGKYSYDEIFEFVNLYDKKFQYAKNNSVLPAKPDMKKINEIIITINSMILAS